MTVIVAGALGSKSAQMSTVFASYGELNIAVNCSFKLLKNANLALRAIYI